MPDSILLREDLVKFGSPVRAFDERRGAVKLFSSQHGDTLLLICAQPVGRGALKEGLAARCVQTGSSPIANSSRQAGDFGNQ